MGSSTGCDISDLRLLMAMHPKQGMLQQFFTHSVLDCILCKPEVTYVTCMRIYVPICRLRRPVGEEIQLALKSVKMRKTANIFQDLLMKEARQSASINTHPRCSGPLR